MQFKLMALLLPLAALGNQSQNYQGTATKKDVLVYTEKHQLTLDDSGKILSSQTQYFDKQEKLIAVLKGDYSKSLNAPDYEFEDLRDGSKHGLRNSGESLFMFSQDKGKAEMQKEVPKSESKGRLIVGGQGLNYYLLQNLDEVLKQKKIPLRFLIPGRLDAYNFEMNVKGVSAEGILEVEIEIDNFFLRLFAPKLIVKYDTQKKRIVGYSGLSNLNDEKGKMQNVNITYKHE